MNEPTGESESDGSPKIRTQDSRIADLPVMEQSVISLHQREKRREEVGSTHKEREEKGKEKKAEWNEGVSEENSKRRRAKESGGSSGGLRGTEWNSSGL